MPGSLGSTRKAPKALHRPEFGPDGTDAPSPEDATIPASPPIRAPVDPARPDDEEAFPIPGWDRYSPIRLLGQGGMGRVFLANDLRLGRLVALKFVRGDDPELSRRIFAEARAQARVEHRHVCKVFEVGEARGKVYIAMQYVEGKPLSDPALRLSFEQKALLIQQAAMGLQEAHAMGLVHRDVKPSNILVAQGAGEEIDACVMDFGVARSLTDGQTMTGTVLGTAEYMSPEQARGEVTTLDRRADVYGLGATLYALLTGAPPIRGENSLDVLNRIPTEEPLSPRAVSSDIPVDLAAITMKCLEKDRSLRYESARALADDLGRFLKGDVVRARPAGRVTRARKMLRKHRTTAALLGVAIAIAATAIGLGVRERGRAADRARAVQRFTEHVEHMESVARYSALSRLHDVRADQTIIDSEMAEIKAEMRTMGDVAAGAGGYALGRGYLAMGRAADATAALREAQKNGNTESRVAYALALALGQQYQEAIARAERVADKAQRQRQREEAAQSYRDPALASLRLVTDADPATAAHAAALIAYYEGRHDDALSALDAAPQVAPWFYEDKVLRGDILLARAFDARDRGDRAEAHAWLDAARKAFSAAAATAESAPAIHLRIAELEYAVLRLALYGEGDIRGPFERGIAEATKAIDGGGESPDTLVLRAGLYRVIADYHVQRGESADLELRAALRDAERALVLSPERALARNELTYLYQLWADAEQGAGRDPTPLLEKAISASDPIPEEERGYSIRLARGLVYQTWADADLARGVLTTPHRTSAIEAYRRAIERNERGIEAWINLGVNLFARASEVRNTSVDRDLEEALSALNKATEIDPDHAVPYYYLGEVYLFSAARTRESGKDPAPELARALEAYERGLTKSPNMPQLWSGVGSARIGQAIRAAEIGGDPFERVEQAITAYQKAAEIAPDLGLSDNNLGYAFSVRGRMERERGRDPGGSLERATLALMRAVQRTPDDASFWANLGNTYLQKAQVERAAGRNARATLGKAREAIETSLRLNPEDSAAKQIRAEVESASAANPTLR